MKGGRQNNKGRKDGRKNGKKEKEIRRMGLDTCGIENPRWYVCGGAGAHVMGVLLLLLVVVVVVL